MKSRQREIEIIRQANQAAAVGRLLLGEFDEWADFFKPDTDDLENLPRRMLKSGKADVQRNLSKEITKFCSRNFRGMDIPKLASLYEEIKAHRGLARFSHRSISLVQDFGFLRGG